MGHIHTHNVKNGSHCEIWDTFQKCQSMQLNKSLLMKALVICQSLFTCKMVNLSPLVMVFDDFFQAFNFPLSNGCRFKAATSRLNGFKSLA